MEYMYVERPFNVVYKRAGTPSELAPSKPHQKLENRHPNILTTT